MIGEIRDEETAGIAINSAMTGHLVLSTLHTNDAATTLPRLLDMAVEPYLAASTVNIAVGQRLVRKICTQCLMSEILTGPALADLAKQIDLKRYLKKEVKQLRFYRGRGCSVVTKPAIRVGLGCLRYWRCRWRFVLIMDHADADAIKRQAITRYDDNV